MRNRLISALTMTTALAIAGGAMAHDFWLQPSRFWLQPQTPVGLTLWVGHGVNRQIWDADIRLVTKTITVGPDGTTTSTPRFNQGGLGQTQFSSAGLYWLGMETTDSVSELPSIRFNDYLKTEGLTPAVEWRKANGQTNETGHEFYSRRAKALVRVGSATRAETAHITRPIGMTLELVPERNPYDVEASRAIPFRVYYKGRPLQGALVKLTNLGADEEPAATQISNRNGHVAFVVPRQGDWQLNVVWTEPLANNPQAQFRTTFSSLTFGFETSSGG